MTDRRRIVAILGAGGTLGAALSHQLAGEPGTDVVLSDVSGPSLEETVGELPESRGEVETLLADVSDAAQVDAVVARTVDRFGRLDVLVSNAGYGIAGTVVDIDEQAWEDLMSVNVRGVFLGAKHAIPVMQVQGGGAIVNTASVVAAIGVRNRAAYVASKGAVAALTRAIAIDHVADNIRCNAIAPGTIDTPYFDEIMKKSTNPADSRKALEARQLVNRLGTPEEIAAGILFLASDESRFATGSILTVDGGMSAY